ncbi:MAG: methyltransferase [Micavibrio sp.]|nr:methyltransferase [Micavibrio sp.]
MTDNAINTLFYPFETERLEWPTADNLCAFINAKAHPELHKLPESTLFIQPFKPYAINLPSPFSTIEEAMPSTKDQSHDIALIALPKNQIESEYYIAKALSALKENATLICAADNKAGGSRIAKTLAKFNLKNINQESKNKARVIWCTKENIDQEYLSKAIENGSPQTIGTTHTQAGIYGWDKVDRGSALLMEHVPKELKGKGADFGCGYGYLSLKALEKAPKIKFITCLDADARALKAAEQNLSAHKDKTAFIWSDLTHSPTLKNLDFILMNPPFHEGKKTDSSIGINFIKSAHAALGKYGELYMVANNQLAYEPALNDIFFKVDKLFEGQGFKVYKALK